MIVDRLVGNGSEESGGVWIMVGGNSSKVGGTGSTVEGVYISVEEL